MALIDEIDAEFIANSIVIDAFDGYYVLVEGETDDVFFSKFLNDAVCQIEICYGKQNVVEVLTLVNSHSKKKHITLGIIDKDFDFIVSPIAPHPSNLITTDFHDIEMMCVNSDSFEHFANEYFSKLKLKKFLDEVKNDSIRNYLLNLTKPISELRIVSLLNNLNLAFKQTTEKTKELDFKKFICKDKFSFKGNNELIETIKKYYNQGTKLNSGQIESQMKSLNLGKYDIYDVCKGHDFSKILVIGLQKRIGKSNITALTPEDIERSLRLSFSILDFQKTELKKKLDKINSSLVKTPMTS